MVRGQAARGRAEASVQLLESYLPNVPLSGTRRTTVPARSACLLTWDNLQQGRSAPHPLPPWDGVRQLVWQQLGGSPTGWVLEAQAATLDAQPSTSYAPEPIESHSSFHGSPVLRSPPLMLVQVQPQSTTANLWVQLGAIIAANVVVVQGVAKLFSKLRDKSSPVTLVKLQLGLVTDQTSIRSKLAELSSMIKVGGKGVWIILEEALLEFAKYQHSCKLADVAAAHMASKSEAYDLFEEVAKSEVQRAQKGEADAHMEGEGDCAVDWDGTGGSRGSKLMQWLRGPEESECDDALVVTLVVAARGDLDIPNTVSSWSDLAGVMKTLGGLSSEQLMALDLTWSPSKDNEFLTKEQLVQDYSNLKPVKTR
eukprot:CAMPEP_0202351400 /NCGR_PEP_ID=MMETSP1126-20121109/8058_1 /ASSEMBLY_ACC=CAM_ASM_000457 /TAXON_ID=3047 /ORGANISM="Dunaliella tertiolecta, Strain CCMP1320" /LENGTH=366 /DNA_ID=CAMNT_0048943505 /DNA_START=27 /DNA_END=1128 /DNA_ORIENTATION=-